MQTWPVRGAWGAVLLVDPDLPLRLGGGRRTRQVTLAVRVLGARHLAEALVLARTSDPRIPRVIRSIDAIHATTMLALARARPDLRRDALLSAASATLLVALPPTTGR